MIFAKIQRLAKDKGMSISEIERKANISKGTICKWRTASPNVNNLKAVADVLGTTVDGLLTEPAAV